MLNLPFLPFCHSYLAMGHGFLGKRDNKDIFPLTTISFEGMEFNCPRDWDSYLRKIYGDYEKLPDLDKLHIHSVETIIP